MAVLNPASFPNRISLEVDIRKELGASSILTLWIGNGPNAFQTDVPLWLLRSNGAHTLKLSGVTLQNGNGEMYVAVQLSGGQDETARVVIQSARIYENDSP